MVYGMIGVKIWTDSILSRVRLNLRRNSYWGEVLVLSFLCVWVVFVHVWVVAAICLAHICMLLVFVTFLWHIWYLFDSFRAHGCVFGTYLVVFERTFGYPLIWTTITIFLNIGITIYVDGILTWFSPSSYQLVLTIHTIKIPYSCYRWKEHIIQDLP